MKAWLTTSLMQVSISPIVRNQTFPHTHTHIYIYIAKIISSLCPTQRGAKNSFKLHQECHHSSQVPENNIFHKISPLSRYVFTNMYID